MMTDLWVTPLFWVWNKENPGPIVTAIRTQKRFAHSIKKTFHKLYNDDHTYNISTSVGNTIMCLLARLRGKKGKEGGFVLHKMLFIAYGGATDPTNAFSFESLLYTNCYMNRMLARNQLQSLRHLCIVE